MKGCDSITYYLPLPDVNYHGKLIFGHFCTLTSQRLSLNYIAFAPLILPNAELPNASFEEGKILCAEGKILCAVLEDNKIDTHYKTDLIFIHTYTKYIGITGLNWFD